MPIGSFVPNPSLITSHTSLLLLHCKLRWKMLTGLPRVVSLPTWVAQRLSYSN